MITGFSKELQHLPLNYKGLFILSLDETVCNLLIRTQKYIRKGITYRIYPLEEQKSISCHLLFFLFSLSFSFVFLLLRKSDEAAASSASMVVTALVNKYVKRSKYSFHDFSAKHTPSATLNAPRALEKWTVIACRTLNS